MTMFRPAAARALCALLAAAVVATPGCGAMLFPTYQEVEVVCTNVPTALFHAPKRGLSVRSGGVLTLDRREEHLILVSAPGYTTREVRVDGEASVWRAAVSIILNGGHGLFTLFITTVIGIGIDLKEGAWMCVETTPVEVELVPGEGGPPAPPAQPTLTAAPTAPASRTCAACGAALKPTQQFCTACGTKAPR